MNKRRGIFLLCALIFLSMYIQNVFGDTDTLYVNGFNDILREWTEVGSSPWLDNDITNELYSSTDNDDHQEFTFANHAGSETINSVTFYAELKGPSARNDMVRITMQVQGGGVWLQIMSQDPDADDYAWYSADLSGYANTWNKINYAKIRVEYEKSGSPATQTLYVRRCYIYVNYQPAPTEVPVNDDCIISDFDDIDNLYSERKYYSLEYDGHDDDGYANIDYILVNITQSSTLRATFKYDEDTNTFSLITGNWEIDVGSSSATRSGTYINATFLVFPSWDAIEESDFDINATIVDAESHVDNDILQTDYGDVITTLVTDEIECTDVEDRVNFDSSEIFDIGVRYANNPASGTPSIFYPPDAEFNSISIYDSNDNNKGSDSSIVNGDGQISFTENFVKSETYNLYVDLNDADWTDKELTDVTETVIWDRIEIYYFVHNETDNRLNINDYIEIRTRGRSWYDSHALGTGDSLSINASATSWDAVNSWFEIDWTESTVDNYTFVVSSLNEVSYGITVYNYSVSYPYCIFDRILVAWTVNTTYPDNGEWVEFTITQLDWDYDDTALSNYDYDIFRNNSLWLNDQSTLTFTDGGYTDLIYIYDFYNVTDKVYGITVFVDVSNITVTWTTHTIVITHISLEANETQIDDYEYFELNMTIKITPDTDIIYNNTLYLDPLGLNISINYYNGSGFSELYDPSDFILLNVGNSYKTDINSTYFSLIYNLFIRETITKEGWYDVRAFTQGSSDIDDYNSVFNLTIRSPTNDPNYLYGSGFNSSNAFVELYWIHNGILTTDYEVENSTDKISWDSLGTPSIPFYNDTSVDNGTMRYYRVKARRLTGLGYKNSSWSDINFERVNFTKVGVGVGVIEYRYPSQSLIMLIFLCITGSIVLLGVRKR